MVLTYSASFPLRKSGTIQEVVRATKQWILGSPNHQVYEKDLDNLGEDKFEHTSQTDTKIITLSSEDKDTKRWSMRMSSRGEGGVYTAEVTGLKDLNGLRFATTLDYSTARYGNFSQQLRTPRITSEMLNLLGGGFDGRSLQVKNSPHRINESETEFVEEILANKSGNTLPVIYLSRGRTEEMLLDSEKLAKALSGLAHILVEPSNEFSFRLWDNTRRSRKTYLGFIGIYWPNGEIERLPSHTVTIDGLVKTISTLSLGVEVPSELTYEGIRRHQTSLEIARLSSEKENIGNQALELAIGEISSREKEIERLRTELARLSSRRGTVSDQTNTGAGLILPQETIQIYEGEVRDIVLEAVKLYRDQHTLNDTRRRDLLSGLLDSNKPTGVRETIIEGLDRILANTPRHISEKIIRDLRALGFEVDNDGAHPKIYVPGQDQRFAVISSTASDSRSGKNMISGIKRKLL